MLVSVQSRIHEKAYALGRATFIGIKNDELGTYLYMDTTTMCILQYRWNLVSLCLIHHTTLKCGLNIS